MGPVISVFDPYLAHPPCDIFLIYDMACCAGIRCVAKRVMGRNPRDGESCSLLHDQPAPLFSETMQKTNPDPFIRDYCTVAETEATRNSPWTRFSLLDDAQGGSH